MNDMNRIDETRQKDCLFQSGISATDDDDISASEEKAVTGGAVADTGADIFCFPRDH